MGLKMNIYGLMYNDAHTSSLGNAFERNIVTSSKDNKYHTLRCQFCGRENRISLSLIEQELKRDNAKLKSLLANKKVDDETKEMEIIYGSRLAFYCGACKMSITITRNIDNEIEIPTIKEYNDSIKSYMTSVLNKADKMGINTGNARDILNYNGGKK